MKNFLMLTLLASCSVFGMEEVASKTLQKRPSLRDSARLLQEHAGEFARLAAEFRRTSRQNDLFEPAPLVPVVEHTASDSESASAGEEERENAGCASIFQGLCGEQHSITPDSEVLKGNAVKLDDEVQYLEQLHGLASEQLHEALWVKELELREAHDRCEDLVNQIKVLKVEEMHANQRFSNLFTVIIAALVASVWTYYSPVGS